MKTNISNLLRLLGSLAITFAATLNAKADSLDLFAGFDATSNNSYFEIQDNTAYDFTNIVFTVTAAGSSDPASVESGWNTGTLAVADVTSGNESINYFNGTQAFQADFPVLYANSGVAPGDLTYQVTGDLNGQVVQLSFNAGDSINNGSAFLGLDQFGNAIGQSDFGQVASLDVAAVPLPGAFYLFATGLVGLFARRVAEGNRRSISFAF